MNRGQGHAFDLIECESALDEEFDEYEFSLGFQSVHVLRGLLLLALFFVLLQQFLLPSSHCLLVLDILEVFF